eukprot:7038158-Pyramimonas_sp.AAC.1
MVGDLSTKEVGAVNRKALEALKMTFTDTPPDNVRLRGLESCKDDDMIKIVIALDDAAKERVVLDSFKATGATVTQGMAPGGYLEEEISAWIDVLKS